MSAAAIISPILITFLNIDSYTAIGISLFSDVLASFVSCIAYYKNDNIDIKNGLIIMLIILLFTMIGSFFASLVSTSLMGTFSVYMTMILGVKFIIKPIMTTKEIINNVDAKKRMIQSIIFGIFIGLICGFIGAGGGMMILIVLTSIMGYELKTAVGTSVFIMGFTALTGSISHFVIGGIPDLIILFLCSIFTLIFAIISSKFANKLNPKTLNRLVGVILLMLGLVIVIINLAK